MSLHTLVILIILGLGSTHSFLKKVTGRWKWVSLWGTRVRYGTMVLGRCWNDVGWPRHCNVMMDSVGGSFLASIFGLVDLYLSAPPFNNRKSRWTMHGWSLEEKYPHFSFTSSRRIVSKCGTWDEPGSILFVSEARFLDDAWKCTLVTDKLATKTSPRCIKHNDVSTDNFSSKFPDMIHGKGSDATMNHIRQATFDQPGQMYCCQGSFCCQIHKMRGNEIHCQIAM